MLFAATFLVALLGGDPPLPSPASADTLPHQIPTLSFSQAAWQSGGNLVVEEDLPGFFQEEPAQVRDPWFAEDKLKHFVASFVVTSLAGGAARAAGLDPPESALVGVSFGAVSGIYKEVADVRAGTFFSGRDLLWDLAGIGIAFLILDSSR